MLPSISFHDSYMQQALKQAQQAFAKNEVPIGAVIINAEGSIIARAHNAVERLSTQLAHAETLAIAKAGKKLSDWRLNECWIYVTLEPCSMCINLIRLSRFAGLVYGASSPLFGYHLDNESGVQVCKKDTFEIIPGVGAHESAELLKRFFQKKRDTGE